MMIYEMLILASLLMGSAMVTTTIWSRQQTRMRLAAMLMFVAMLPLLAGSGFMALGHSAPWVSGLTIPDGQHEVISVYYDQDVAIYLWLDVDGEPAPRYFHLSWSDVEAQRIQNMMDDRKSTGQRFRVGVPTDLSNSDRRVYHATPQPRMPEKVIPEEAPMIYGHTP